MQHKVKDRIRKAPKETPPARVSTERVNHPEHYGGDATYEAIKVIEAWGLNFHLGNVVKYAARAGRKLSTSYLEDLKKARWYLDREIANVEIANRAKP